MGPKGGNKPVEEGEGGRCANHRDLLRSRQTARSAPAHARSDARENAAHSTLREEMSSAQRKSGLGGDGIWLGIAKLWFLVSSYAITISLTHLLTADVYGSYYAIARLVAVPNMVIIYTLLFSVSRPL